MKKEDAFLHQFGQFINLSFKMYNSLCQHFEDTVSGCQYISSSRQFIHWMAVFIILGMVFGI